MMDGFPAACAVACMQPICFLHRKELHGVARVRLKLMFRRDGGELRRQRTSTQHSRTIRLCYTSGQIITHPPACLLKLARAF